MSELSSRLSPNETACHDGQFTPSTVSPQCRGGFDFTVFFEEVVLCILPAALYLLSGSVESAFMLWKPTMLVTKSPLRLVKLASILAFAAIQVALIALWALHPLPSTSIPLVSSILSLLVAAVLAANSVVAHRASPRPSLIICAYLFLSGLTDIPRVRTMWMLNEHDASAALLSCSLAVKLVLLALESVGKRQWLADEYNSISQEETSGFFSRGLFLWLVSLLLSGSRQALKLRDLRGIHQKIGSTSVFPQLKESLKATGLSSKYSLVYATLRAWPWEAAKIAIPRLLVVACNLLQPLVVQAVVDNILAPDSQPTRNNSYGLIGAIALTYTTSAVATGIYQQLTFRYLALIRGGLISNIFHKLSEIPTKVVTDSDSPVMTLIGTDVERICETWNFLIAELWPSVLQLAIGVWLLERELGAVCIAPVILALVSTFVGTKAGTFVVGRQGAWLAAVQRRVNFTSHALTNIKNVKMLGYTNAIQSIIQTKRIEELEMSKRFRRLSSFNICLVNLPGMIGPIITFAAFAIASQLSGNTDFNTSKAIASLALISVITSPLSELLYSIPQAYAAVGCFNRIQDFLKTEEADDARLIGKSDTDVSHPDANPPAQESKVRPSIRGSTIIRLHNATIGWQTPIVHNINMTLTQDSKFLALVGPIASGKSTILNAILGEAQLFSGSISLASKDTAFCSQVPWLPVGRVRDQIISDYRFSEKWYSEVIESCALDVDIASLKDGDMTDAGAQGASLSGGQRQRIAIARALYSRRPIAIFDDVLSALDSSTQDILAQRVFGRNGLLRRMGTAVILSTHSIRHLDVFDTVVALTADGYQCTEPVQTVSSGSDIESAKDHLNDTDGVAPTATATKDTKLVEEQRQKADDLAAAERSIGDLAVYKYYFASLGWVGLSIFAALIITDTGFGAVQLAWLKLWSGSDDVSNTKYWLSLYALWVVIEISALFGAVYHLYVGIVPKSGQRLHLSVLRAAFEAPMSFYAKTKVGTLVNRFSQDMQLIDMILPGAFITTAFQFSGCIATATFTIVATPYFAAVLPFILATLGLLHRFYLRTSKQLRLLELESKAPLYSHIIDTMNGIATIRAFGWFQSYKDKYFELLDDCQKPFYLLLCIQRWLGLVLGLVVAGMATVLTGIAVAIRGTNVSAGFIGIALVNMMSLSQTLASLIMFWTSLETSLGAVSRVKTFSEDTPKEDEPKELVADAWPRSGHVKFDNVTASYTDFAALRNMAIEIKHGEKVAVCGRTGSGKSSFITSLLGMMDITSGSITLDGLDLSHVSKDAVRNKVTCITQDPFLFTGSLRQNLNPVAECNDAEAMRCLIQVGLWDTLTKEAPDGAEVATVLGQEMDDMHLSHGQRQLFCLARALLRKSKLVLLDEPTASVDVATEAKMSEIIETEFKDATIIMVTHRLSSIHSFDRVMVLEAGELVENDAPASLLANPSSKLQQLYRVQVHDS